MSATGKTTNYNLPIYQPNDVTSYLVDFNGAMSEIDSAIYTAKSGADSANTKFDNLSTNVENINETIVNIQSEIITVRNNGTDNTQAINLLQTHTNEQDALIEKNASDITGMNGKVEKNASDISSLNGEVDELRNSVQSGYINGTDFITSGVGRIVSGELFWKKEELEQYRVLTISMIIDIQMNMSTNTITFDCPYIKNLITVTKSTCLTSSILDPEKFFTRLSNANLYYRGGNCVVKASENLENHSTSTISLSGDIVEKKN